MASRSTTAESLKNLLQYHTDTDEAIRVLVDMATDQQERLDSIERKVEPLPAMAERLDSIDTAVRQLQQMEVERRKREKGEADNRLSSLFQHIAFTLSIILFTTPAVLWFQENPLVWLMSLLAAIASTLIASVVTRRNGKE